MAKVFFTAGYLATLAAMALACVPGAPEVACTVAGLIGMAGTVTCLPFVLAELASEALDEMAGRPE